MGRRPFWVTRRCRTTGGACASCSIRVPVRTASGPESPFIAHRDFRECAAHRIERHTRHLACSEDNSHVHLKFPQHKMHPAASQQFTGRQCEGAHSRSSPYVAGSLISGGAVPYGLGGPAGDAANGRRRTHWRSCFFGDRSLSAPSATPSRDRPPAHTARRLWPGRPPLDPGAHAAILFPMPAVRPRRVTLHPLQPPRQGRATPHDPSDPAGDTAHGPRRADGDLVSHARAAATGHPSVPPAIPGKDRMAHRPARPCLGLRPYTRA